MTALKIRWLSLIAVALISPSLVDRAWAGGGNSDVVKITWYLKGQADALFPSRGWQTLSLFCKPAGNYVTCHIKVLVGDRGIYCANGAYRVVGFSIKGQSSKPYRCAKKTKAKGPAS